MIEYLKLLCPDNEIEVTDNELVNCAIKFIQRNFYNLISNHDIAKACTCSVSTVCHLFKKSTGITIVDYKTGTIDTHIESMKYGLHMQLPVYLYLIH